MQKVYANMIYTMYMHREYTNTTKQKGGVYYVQS